MKAGPKAQRGEHVTATMIALTGNRGIKHVGIAVSALEEEETKERFKVCTERIAGLGFDEEDSEKVVGQAFGWGKQAYWLNKKKDTIPDLERVNIRLKAPLAYIVDRGACLASQGRHTNTWIVSTKVSVTALAAVAHKGCGGDSSTRYEHEIARI